MKIAIFGNIYKETILSHIQTICNFFSDKNTILLFEEKLYNYISCSGIMLPHVEIIRNRDFTADIALSIGGDGTFLNTASRIGDKGIPILGVNIGRLGFLVDVSDDNLIKALQTIIDGEYKIEERTLLHVETSDGTVLENPYALNEVAILKQDISSMIAINTIVNGEAVHTYEADGLLIATPTGSTAYSLSVGGPIITPQAQNFILSPVASHSLNVRPLIIPDNWVIELDVFSRTYSYMIAIDGRSQTMDDKTKLRIKKAGYTIKLIKQHEHTFFDTLKNKLMWGVDVRN